MPSVIWDASALAKRYAYESGGETVDAVFRYAKRPMLTTAWGYAETFSVLLRQRNDRRLDASTFAASVRLLQHEVVDGDLFEFVDVSTESVMSSLTLMARHNLNATDAALLMSWLIDFRSRVTERDTILIASDQRLVRAANAEGLATLNPELVSPDSARLVLARP